MDIYSLYAEFSKMYHREADTLFRIYTALANCERNFNKGLDVPKSVVEYIVDTTDLYKIRIPEEETLVKQDAKDSPYGEILLQHKLESLEAGKKIVSILEDIIERFNIRDKYDL